MSKWYGIVGNAEGYAVLFAGNNIRDGLTWEEAHKLVCEGNKRLRVEEKEKNTNFGISDEQLF